MIIVCFLFFLSFLSATKIPNSCVRFRIKVLQASFLQSRNSSSLTTNSNLTLQPPNLSNGTSFNYLLKFQKCIPWTWQYSCRNLHANSLSYFLLLFNSILLQGTYPLIRKLLIILPILRSSIKTPFTLNRTNRIALTSILKTLSKLLHKIFYGLLNLIVYSLTANTASGGAEITHRP